MTDANSACDKWPTDTPNFGGPFPTRTWSRGSGDVCIGTAESRALAKKIEVLQYKKNSANLTKKQKWAQLAKGTSHNKKKAWATQTQTFTDPNVNNLARIGNNSLERCPPCPEKVVIGDQTVSSQEQADALRGVTIIIGNLFIEFIEGDVIDLSPFDCLAEVTGRFVIRNNTTLTTITGFGNLTDVGESFNISFNSQLKTIDGFGNLEKVGSFGIINNSNLTTLNGFGVLMNVGAQFTIFGNNELTTMADFGNLTDVIGDFSIFNNAKLAAIDGFINLTDIGGFLSIGVNNNIESINGFGLLVNVLGIAFSISNNAKLATIAGFSNMRDIGGDFIIDDNSLLTNIAFKTAFNNLEQIGGNIFVNNNAGGNNWDLPTDWTTTPLNWGQDNTRSVTSNNFTSAAQMILNGLPFYIP